MGDRTVCRKNQVCYSCQDGIHAHSTETVPNDGTRVEHNLIVGPEVNGIWFTDFCRNSRAFGNRILQSNSGVNLRGPGGVAGNNEIYRFYCGVRGGPSPVVVRNNRILSGRPGVTLEEIAEPGSAISGNQFGCEIYAAILNQVTGASLTDNRMLPVGDVYS